MEDAKYLREPNLALRVCLFVYLMVTAGFVLSCNVSGFTYRIKQDTLIKVYHEFVNCTTASPF